MESSRLFFDPSPCHGNVFFLGNRDSIFQGSRTMMNLEEGSRRRPFFSSPDELFDEEYYDEQSPEKKRRLTSEQVHMLEMSFEAENKLEPERKTQLANKLGLQPRQVAVWFQNRRARWKTKQLERDYDILKSSYDSLLSDYKSFAKENDKLKSEVISLTEKLQAKDEEVAPVSGQKPDPLPADRATVSALQFSSIVGQAEDRLSSGSGGSAVVVDSGDSYFSNDDFPGYMVPSEEDDGSDDGQSYFCNAFAVANEEQNEGEMMQWWVWS